MKHASSILSACVLCAVSFTLSAQTPPAPAPAAPQPAPPAAAPPPPAEPAPTQRIGKETKQAIGKVIDVEKVHNGCMLDFKDDKGNEFIELGTDDLCTRKPPLKGQRLHFVYREETVLANDCMGNPKCKRTEVLPVIVEVRPLN